MNTFSPHRELQISVIIVNYNVRDYLQQSLFSLQRALRPFTSEIIVVDNASDDGSVAMLRRRFPRVKVIANKENVGFGKANNDALKRAKGRYFFLLNPDTIVQEDTLHVLYDFMEQHPEAGMAGCKILNPDGSFQLPCRRSFPTPWVAFTKIVGLSTLFPKTRLFGKYNVTYRSTEETYPVDAISGSCMFLRREVYEQVGGFDEAFYMYGEDLDWCYRIQQAGWKIYYVHSTKIIHYKGESTKRSSIDELRTFYEAMHIFVEKHFGFAPLLVLLLKLSIAVVSGVASVVNFFRTYALAVVDSTFLILSLLIAEYLRKGDIFTYPHYAYPHVYTVPVFVTIFFLAVFGVYTRRKMSLTHSIGAVVTSYVILSALTAFFKEYAFSRAILLYSGVLASLFLPGWRFGVRIFRQTDSNRALWRRRTLIVGTGKSASEVARKIQQRPDVGYDIIGFVGTTHAHVGERISGLPVLSSLEALPKVIREQKITDIIFAPRSVDFERILTIISQNQQKGVVFHVVPTSMEVMIGKASVEMLNEVPLVEVSYNINKSLNRLTKRIFDVCVSFFLLLMVYPIFLILKSRKKIVVQYLWRVLKGDYSLVGRRIKQDNESDQTHAVYLGKPGLTGIVQLLSKETITKKEEEQYDIYYARNQSFSVDLEILIKTALQLLRKR